jgi:hypothetical protein
MNHKSQITLYMFIVEREKNIHSAINLGDTINFDLLQDTIYLPFFLSDIELIGLNLRGF